MILQNRVIETKYQEVENYARFIANVNGNKLSHHTAISNAYIKSLNHAPKDENEAKAIIFHYIKCELLWTRTATKKEIITAVDIDCIPEIIEQKNEIDFHDIIDKEVDTWNFIERVFFRKYMELKLQNKRLAHLAEYYGIDKEYCRKLVSKLKKRIRCKI